MYDRVRRSDRRLTMIVPRWTSAITLAAIALGTASVANAGDGCLTLSGAISPSVWVLKTFKAPGKGVCKPITGIRLTFPFSGVACTNSTRDTLRLGFTWYASGSTQHFAANIPLPAESEGSYTQFIVSTVGVGSASGSASIAPCDPSKQPVP